MTEEGNMVLSEANMMNMDVITRTKSAMKICLSRNSPLHAIRGTMDEMNELRILGDRQRILAGKHHVRWEDQIHNRS
jgi:hypothetical protein